MINGAKEMVVTWYEDHKDTVIGVFGLVLVAGIGALMGSSKGYKDGLEIGYRNGIRDVYEATVDYLSEDA